MLEPIQHPLVNVQLGKPSNWNDATDGECITLPVHRDQDGYYSWFTFTFLDRLKALIGVPIRLHIVGSLHPPIALEMQRDGWIHPFTRGFIEGLDPTFWVAKISGLRKQRAARAKFRRHMRMLDCTHTDA